MVFHRSVTTTTVALLASTVSMVSAGQLDDEVLSELRIEGMCAKLSQTDSEETIRNYNHILKIQRETQAFSQAFQEMLLNILDDNYDGLSKIVTEFCQSQDYLHDSTTSVSFEDCMKIEGILRECKITEAIIGKCYDFAEEQEITPTFESMDQRNQDKERCLMDFQEDDIMFRPTDPTETIVEALEKYGVVIIKQFFDVGKMSAAHETLRDWRETGVWDDLTFEKFHSSSHMWGNSKGTVRGEVVLPFQEPFRSIVDQIDHSILMDVMQTYGQRSDTDVLNMECPTSIFSKKGSPKQPLHRDYLFPKTLLKIAVSTHDTPKIQGPTGFCPCTHTHGEFFPIWESDIECPLHFQPEFLPAGTVVLYDQAIRHQGMPNQYDTRFILDISYTFGEYKSTYIENGDWSTEAIPHVEQYRANRKVQQQRSEEDAASEAKEAL